MELVYLWVEGYKNIKKQGFNFSPRFECDYDEEKKELTINENKNHLKNFFGENINVTAIVGENGSGKSSLQEQLILLFFNSLKIDKKNENRAWVLTYDKTKEWINIHYLNQENPVFTKININNNIIQQNSIDTRQQGYSFYTHKQRYYNLFYNPSIELVSSSFLSWINDTLKDYDGAIYDLYFKPEELNIFAFPSKKNRVIDIKKNENNILITMYKSIKFLNVENIELKLDELLNNKKLNFIPSKIRFSNNIDDVKYLIKRYKPETEDILFPKYKNLSFKSLYAYFITFILSTATEDQNKEFKNYFFQNDLITNYLQKTYNNQKQLITEKNPFPMYKFTEYILTNIEEFIELTEDINLLDSLKESSIKLDPDIFETAKLIDVLKTCKNVDILNHPISNRDTILKILPVVPSYIRVDAHDKNNVSFIDFSYGEKNLISLIYSLIYYTHFFTSKDDTINIFLDEIETGLNPKWQKELINILVPLFDKLNVSLNIIISSHSPFILSDIPKENVIFLKDGKQVDVDINPFGANIHTLLSHGFFMEDGLIGEFAKGKIQNVINFITDKESNLKKEEIFPIIELIGEPFLKQKLKEQYFSKYPMERDIDNEISTLEKKLTELKNAKNSK